MYDQIKSGYYEKKYKGGDINSIFQYIQEDICAFRSPWVIEQLEEWRKSNNNYMLGVSFMVYMNDFGDMETNEKKTVGLYSSDSKDNLFANENEIIILKGNKS